MATLEDLEDLLSSMNKSISEQNGFLKSIFELQNKNAEEERRRRESERADRSRAAPPTPSVPRGSVVENDQSNFDRGMLAGQSFLGAFLGAAGILSSLQGLAASAGALSLALVGFTGWEVDIIKSIGTGLKSVTGAVSTGITKLRDSILTRFFGFTPEGVVIRDPTTGRFTRGLSVADQISERISKLRTGALAIFGLGPDGRPLNIRGADGKFLGTSIVGRVTAAIVKILSPLRAVADGVAGFITGAGKGIWDFISPYIGKVGSFVGLVGKILKPIGILFSAYEGIQAFMGKEGTLFEKFGAGISTFVADFVGVPFDLIKNGMLWIIKKFFPGLTTPDGSFDESTVIGRILQLASDFSIADTIKYLVEAPFKLITNISGWISDKINWVSSEAEKLGDTFKQKIDQMKDKLTSLPDRARLIAESMINDTTEKLKIGFLNLGNWIASIPAKIKLMAFEALKFATSRLPNWAQIISDEDLAAARRDVETGNPNIQNRISEIRSNAQTERSRIAAELDLLRTGSTAAQNTVVINAPDNSTKQFNTQGGSSSSVVNAVGGNGGSDLDRMSIPGGVQ